MSFSKGFHLFYYCFLITLLNHLLCKIPCCLDSPVVVTGTVVVSMSAGRVGVTVSAGVVVSTETNIKH